MQQILTNSQKLFYGWIAFLLFLVFSEPAYGQTVIYPESGSPQEFLAAKEVRRYLYLRTDSLYAFRGVQSLPADEDLILVGADTNPLIGQVTDLKAPKGGFLIKSEKLGNRTVLVIAEDDSISTLHGA